MLLVGPLTLGYDVVYEAGRRQGTGENRGSFMYIYGAEDLTVCSSS